MGLHLRFSFYDLPPVKLWCSNSKWFHSYSKKMHLWISARYHDIIILFFSFHFEWRKLEKNKENFKKLNISRTSIASVKSKAFLIFLKVFLLVKLKKNKIHNLWRLLLWAKMTSLKNQKHFVQALVKSNLKYFTLPGPSGTLVSFLCVMDKAVVRWRCKAFNFTFLLSFNQSASHGTPFIIKIC